MTDNSYHESGHTVMAKIFEDYFETKFVTLDKDYSWKFDPRSEGGIYGRARKLGTEMTFADHDAIVMIFLAGYCVDGIVNNNGILKEKFFHMGSWGPQFATERYSGDAELISVFFHRIKIYSPDINWEEYISKAIRCTCQILQDHAVWENLVAVRTALIASPNRTLIAENLDAVFNEDNLQNHMYRKLPLLLASRRSLVE
ncbi:hypothetical protein [Flavobacterium sp.]|uniref:hypothetical protein n=1 Tax=Flavobacterium sp. TaxID=239 RepID=UPI0040337E4B